MQPTIAVVGSADPRRDDYDPPVRDAATASRAAGEIGKELAINACRAVVYSSDDRFIEAAVVRGYVGSGQARLSSIQIRARYGAGDAGLPEVDAHPGVFETYPEATTDWEVAYYRSLLAVDGVLLLGGGRSTFIAGLIALSRQIPVVPIAAFGGGAEKVWHRLAAERTLATEEDLALAAADWRSGSAAAVVTSVVRQHHSRLEQEQARRRDEARTVRRTAFSLLTGLVLLLLGLATIPLLYVLEPGTGTAISVLVAAPLLAAMCGAIVRNTFDAAGSWLRATVLGAAAGAVAFLLFVASQLAVNPDALAGEAARRLIFFVLAVGFVGGLTFDAVYSRLRAQDATSMSIDRVP